MFVDRCKVKVAGGHGGHGCASFRREKYVPRGGPDGGDGGDGGDVVFRTSVNVQCLEALHYMPHYEGGNGKHGMGKKQHGARGETRIVDVPCGTIIRDVQTGEDLVDLDHYGQEFVAVRGGRGGRGNCHFVTSTRRAPDMCEEGQEGEELELALELKIIADVGLVGYPNAGKSTLISVISDARPKTAPYPFTTLRPVIGVVEFPDYHRFTVADIPGLIDGAHENVGLGHEFLRHIERARVLVYVIDTEGTDNRNPWEDLVALQRELEFHQEGLSTRPAVVVANKMDGEHAAENLGPLREATDLPVFPVCAVLGEDTDAVVCELRRLLELVKE